MHLRINNLLRPSRTTPFTLLFVLYNAKLILKLRLWTQMELSKQCQCLQEDNISNNLHRKTIVDNLMQDSPYKELKNKSYLRIRLKSVLAQFHRDVQKLKYFTNVSQWTGHDIMISFITHFISISTEEHCQKVITDQNVWEFVDFLRVYIGETGHDGSTFLAQFIIIFFI
eukprot:320242_1